MDMSLSSDDCWDKCLKNCFRTGYAIADVLSGRSKCITWTIEIAIFSCFRRKMVGIFFFFGLAAKRIGCASFISKYKRM